MENLYAKHCWKLKVNPNDLIAQWLEHHPRMWRSGVQLLPMSYFSKCCLTIPLTKDCEITKDCDALNKCAKDCHMRVGN